MNEKQRLTVQKLKRILGKMNLGVLNKVSVLKDRVIYELTSKQNIKQVCYKENKIKFTQTQETLAIKSKL